MGDDIWTLVERPGFEGKAKRDNEGKWDRQYGEGNWKRVWKYGGEMLDFEGICKHYENAYFEHAKENPEIWLELLSCASDVYDNDFSNIHSGTDYSIQESGSIHIQDIAVRNVVRRMGWEFRGNRLVRVRKHSKESYERKEDWGFHLSPGKIRYHEPWAIERPSVAELAEEEGKEPWYGVGTVEDMYQSNKWLAVRSSVLGKT